MAYNNSLKYENETEVKAIDPSMWAGIPNLQNNLPLFIRNISSISRFKNAIKNYLFKKAICSLDHLQV